jgi:hypothetical protein
VFAGEIHTNLWVPAPIASRGGKKFWDTFIDDKTHLTNIYFLRTKDKCFDTFIKYKAWVERQMSAKIKVLNSDRGGEYLNTAFNTHQEARVAERRNRTIAEHMCMLLHASGLPKYLWAEAVRHVVWLLN